MFSCIKLEFRVALSPALIRAVLGHLTKPLFITVCISSSLLPLFLIL